MINFFRKIRYDLMEKNKTGKYLKYAIGEIVLVVIGILIALSINNWNEERNLKKIEKEYLINLKRDFEYNKVHLEEKIDKCNYLSNLGKLVLGFTGRKEKPETEAELDSLLLRIPTTPSYSPKNGFLDDLIFSGKLGIFQNIELRNLLSSWKPSEFFITERVAISFQNGQEFNRFVMDTGSWLNVHPYSPIEHIRNYPSSGFDIDNRNLLTNLKFENFTEYYVVQMDALKGNLSNTLELCNEILELLNEEIEEKGI